MMMLGPGMNVMMRSTCGPCGGEGKQVASACKVCSGKKFKSFEKVLHGNIQPGMRPGDSLQFPGECSDTAEYSEPGDVNIHLQDADEDIRFKRISGTDDLKAAVTICLKDALLGREEKIHTHPAHPQGLIVEIPVGVQHGDSIFLEGKGMPRKSGGYGRLQVMVSVIASEAEKKALVAGAEKLREIFTEARTP
jgi:DnaJ-class molecular chaperone